MSAKIIDRDDWKRNQNECHWPGCLASYRGGAVMDCHEIIGGADRPKTILFPAFWLWLCRFHHSPLGSRPFQESLVRQLAVKRFSDPDYDDLELIVKLWRPKATEELVVEINQAVNVEYRRIVRDFA
jgi:hypothetical protein